MFGSEEYLEVCHFLEPVYRLLMGQGDLLGEAPSGQILIESRQILHRVVQDRPVLLVFPVTH